MNRYNFHTTDWYEIGGVYIIYGASGQVIYVGQTDNFKRRMAEHKADTAHLMHRYNPAFVDAENISDPYARTVREQALIFQLRPLCNQRM